MPATFWSLTGGWSAGKPFYYSYGFTITVEDMPDPEALQYRTRKEGAT